MTTGKHFPSKLEAGQHYIVTRISKGSLTLANRQGKTKRLTLDSLKDAP